MNGHASPEADLRATGGLTPLKMFSFVIMGNSTLSRRETRAVVLTVAVRGKEKKKPTDS